MTPRDDDLPQDWKDAGARIERDANGQEWVVGPPMSEEEKAERLAAMEARVAARPLEECDGCGKERQCCTVSVRGKPEVLCDECLEGAIEEKINEGEFD